MECDTNKNRRYLKCSNLLYYNNLERVTMQEYKLKSNDFLVSQTDEKGIILFANIALNNNAGKVNDISNEIVKISKKMDEIIYVL